MSKKQINNLKDLIEQLFISAVSGNPVTYSIPIGCLSEMGRVALSTISDFDLNESIHFCVHTSDLRHIFMKHYGSNESARNELRPLSMTDIREIANVLVHPDYIINLGIDNGGNKFAFILENEDNVLTIIEVYAHKKAKLTIKTFYNAIDGDKLREKLLSQNPKGRTFISDTQIPIMFCPLEEESEEPEAKDGLEAPSRTSETCRE